MFIADNNKLYYLFKAGYALMFLSSLNPWFLWGCASFVALFQFVISAFFYTLYPSLFFLSKKNIVAIYLLFIFYVSTSMQAGGALTNLLSFFIFSCLLMIRDDVKIDIIEYVSKVFASILFVSLLFFLLNYMFYSMQFVYSNFREQYYFKNYFVFLSPEIDHAYFFPRFQSVFLEPGHIGMISSFLLYVQRFNLKKWYNVVILISALFSFSLAAYVLLFVGVIMLIYIKSKRLFLFACVLFSVSISSFVVYNWESDSMFNKLIVERLKYDNGDISGNNRYSEDFEREYEAKISTADKWFGWQPDFLMYKGGNAGYKRYISTYGIVGLFIAASLYLSFCKGYKKISLSIFALFALAFIQRSYPFWASELMIFICGLPLFVNSK